MSSRMCPDCVAAMLGADENDLMSIHLRCLNAFMEKKQKHKSAQQTDVETPDKAQAIKVVFARMLGATHRRIAELFTGKANQATGALLLAKSENQLGLPEALIDSDAMDAEVHQIAAQLDWHEGTGVPEDL